MLKGHKTQTNSYLIKQLPKATAFINRRYEIVHASDKWLSDFSFSNDHVFGKTIHELFTNINKDWQIVLKNCLKGRSSDSNIESFIDCEGNKKWFEWINIPWYDEKENIIGIILQTEDVTEKISNEIRLEKLEILSDEMSDIAKIGLWEYDLVEDKMSWSNITKNIHEVPLNYVPNLEDATNFYKNGYSRNTFSIILQKAINTGTPWNEKFQMITAKGNEIRTFVSAKPLYKNSKFIGLIGTIQDITELSRSEERTRENEYLLRTLIDNLPLNVFIKDLHSKKLLANRSEIEFCRVQHEDEVLGKDNFSFYEPKTARELREDDLSVMLNLKPIINKEMTHYMKDGREITFLTSKIPLIGVDGAAYGLVGISLDISDLKQKEMELRGLINVTSLQNKKLINFAHIVSHNLRSHTANFSMLLDFLVAEENETEKEKIVKMMVAASDNLLESLDNLNEVLAINTNINLEKKPIRLTKKVVEVEKNLKDVILNSNAQIINKIPENLNIMAIPAYLESILMNFITNAIKFKSPRRDPIITLSTETKNGYTVLSIKDNGLGIDLNKYGDKLFGMYKTFHYKKHSKGIGLFIVKNQIEAMNGKVTASSKVNKGTTFNIFFDEKN